MGLGLGLRVRLALAQLRSGQLQHAVVGQRPEERQVAQQAMHRRLAWLGAGLGKGLGSEGFGLGSGSLGFGLGKG